MGSTNIGVRAVPLIISLLLSTFGCDSRTDNSTSPMTPGATTGNTPAPQANHPANSPIDRTWERAGQRTADNGAADPSLSLKIVDARRKLAADEAALSEMEAGRIQAASRSPAYQAAAKEKEAASELARQAAAGDADMPEASHQLVVATQNLWELKRAALANSDIQKLQSTVAEDENLLVALLKEQSTAIAVASAADKARRKPGSANAAASPGAATANGDVFVRGHNRKDGTYAPSSTRLATGAGNGHGQ